MEEQGHPQRSQDHFPQGQHRSFPGGDFLDSQVEESVAPGHLDHPQGQHQPPFLAVHGRQGSPGGGEQEKDLQAVNAAAEDLRREYKAVAANLKISVEETQGPDNGLVVSREVTDKFIQVLVLSPNGISEMNAAVPGVVQSSDNLGEIRLEREQNRLVVVYEIRTSFRSKAEYIWDKIHLLAQMVGGTCEKFAAYPGWPHNPDSRLTPLVQQVYEETFGEKMDATPIHSGLECGCLIEKKPDLDAISLGPDCWDLHSPQERLSIKSTIRMYEFLKKLLEQIA